MAEKLLAIHGLHAAVEGKEILKGLNIEINKGEVHVIMGPNGSGKSTLVNLIMGHPKYEITAGSIAFEGEDITALKTFERARKGIFLSFQNPEEIPGITVENLLRTAKNAITGETIKIMAFKKELKQAMETLKIDNTYAARHVNVGFSGGEKKRNEILQMMMLNPQLAMLDETDSGLDIDAVRIVSSGVKHFKNEQNAILIITHNTKILEQLDVDYVHILMNGKILQTGDASLISQINENGFLHLGGDALDSGEVNTLHG
ncbi:MULTISPECIES: Fe-S cluster assembly ATPase SufC [Pelosinus]|uniref:FeS assembly ATPase SufC n=1 Tax=Pelosinus fermentans B4 TaxID=1149862 RepID=I9B5Z5_9FIRM|nr:MULTISPECIES: Fe-S cluster assembly ATPase SufC [Pelosinus]EIW20552.1 FeS assembly ATPase SufC [Pelosinus fermentans B4]EIW25733.1 FeS assembly ATPase SufC [Pelosinus fermentans A11]OAM93457.1 FeS assembly ATPase SufC [Pelosinus fermentans DSM 17108]SDQ78514.1 Iron-regulated ABC transporter ATPase subunit SufC [Pelosinus fermentans]